MCIIDGAIKVIFLIGYSDGRGTDILIVVEFITTNYHTDSADLSLIGSHGANKVGIRNFFTSWYLMGLDKTILSGYHICDQTTSGVLKQLAFSVQVRW